MAQINKSNEYFNTKLYTQNASTNAITGVNFQPDFTWIKNRDSGTRDHRIFDSVRGANKPLKVNGTNAEATETDTLNSFDSDGFTLGADTQGYGVNDLSGNNTVSWNWLGANGTASNTDGSITSTVSANTTSGFSIVSYTGTGSVATVGHGLSSTPKIVLIKNRDDGTTDWLYYTTQIDGSLDSLRLNNTNTKSDSGFSLPTSSVFSINGSSSTGFSGQNYIAYCFAEVKGFSKFGSYVANASDDGPMIYLGFKPAFVLIKRTSNTNVWILLDNKRGSYNVNQSKLFPDNTDAENTDTSNGIDFLSNGFKIRRNNTEINGASGDTFIYMAFAEEPLVGDNPATAR